MSLEETTNKFMLMIGSSWSVVLHTIFFIAVFLVGVLHLVDWPTVLLVLTTVVSLEAIYLSLFIQMAVNQNTKSLIEVEESVDAIEEDVDEIQKDVDEIQEDVEEIQHDIDEIEEDVDEIQKDVDEINEEDRLDVLQKGLESLLIQVAEFKKQSHKNEP